MQGGTLAQGFHLREKKLPCAESAQPGPAAAAASGQRTQRPPGRKRSAPARRSILGAARRLAGRIVRSGGRSRRGVVRRNVAARVGGSDPRSGAPSVTRYECQGVG